MAPDNTHVATLSTAWYYMFFAVNAGCGVTAMHKYNFDRKYDFYHVVQIRLWDTFLSDATKLIINERLALRFYDKCNPMKFQYTDKLALLSVGEISCTFNS